MLEDSRSAEAPAPVPSAKGRRKASSPVKATAPVPSSAPLFEIAPGGDLGSGEQEATPGMKTTARVPLASTIDKLRTLQSQRRFCIVSQSRIDRSCEAFIARALGYHSGLPEKDRKALWAKASAFRKGVEGKGGEGHASRENQMHNALSACIPIVTNSAAARAAWDKLRLDTEKEMRKLARSLPVWSWADGVRGFGDLGVGIITGEAGDLSNYATKERLWKRLGLAVIAGERQQRKTGPAALEHGFSPLRRAEVWNVAESLFRAQWAADKDEDGKDLKKSGKPVAVPAHPTGPYGEVYAIRKAHTEGREGWPRARRHNDARRIMGKFLVENLWRVWNGKPPLEPSDIATPRTEIADLETDIS